MANLMAPKKLKDTFYIMNSFGKFLDIHNAFTLSSPYDDDIFTAISQRAARDYITAHSISGATVVDISRFT